jgi:hypothetical protein
MDKVAYQWPSTKSQSQQVLFWKFCKISFNFIKIYFFLGDRVGAGTSARCFVEVFGANGSSGRRPLDAPDAKFERKQTDEFGFECVDLGEISKIMIGHDNSGFGPGWFLEKVVVTQEKSQKSWYFLHGKWLAKDEEDGAIEREIAASSEDGQVRNNEKNNAQSFGKFKLIFLIGFCPNDFLHNFRHHRRSPWSRNRRQRLHQSSRNQGTQWRQTFGSSRK